ncbi:ABC transporter substrate-binding protein [Sedimentitalea sp. HM32M-2]|uniref:ABC transporter substrate-binding protein n=1 Tax=Sedimentitalea sp. HM32M-2 TaxID=3351566 RepID=UPI00362912D7
MNRMDRRALFSSGVAAALLAASGVSLHAAPRPGGRLRLALPRQDDALGRLVRGAAFETLTEIAANGGLQGELATSWRADATARNWQITLRSGHRFHDGRQLTSRDVADSLLAHRALGHIDFAAVRATAPDGIRLDLALGNPDLPILLADPALIICAGGQVDLPLYQAVGSGCYRTLRLDSQRHYLGERVLEHHKSGRAGWLDRVEALVIPDAGVRAEALRDGFVDVAVLPKPGDLRGHGDLVFHPSADNMVLAMHAGVGKPPLIGASHPLDDGRLAERWWRV